MFQGTQGKEQTLNDLKDIDPENPKFNSNPIMKPAGHEKYSEEDIDKCPVMSGKIPGANPHANMPQQDEDDDDAEYTSSSDEEDEEPQMNMPAGHEGYSEADKEKCPVMSGKVKVSKE
mmetsp:Transcript_39899/g.35598  ORF Transcript_39899/g.35598 Transcript_39899/m.35598 type:complete len:118 (+) Transcript_39899:71-424(+)